MFQRAVNRIIGGKYFAVWVLGAVVAAGFGAVPQVSGAVRAFSGPVSVRADLIAYWGANGLSLSLAGLMLVASFGFGVLVIDWLGVKPGSADKISRPASVLFGFGMYACADVALGLCGLLFSSVAWLLLIAGAAAGFFMLRKLKAGLPGRSDDNVRVWRAVFWVVFIFLSIFCLTPETGDDALGYHLTAPADFNKLHKWVDIRQETYRYPLLAEGMFGQGLLLFSEQTATLVNLSGGFILFWLLKEAVSILAGVEAGWIAAIALMAGNQVGFHLGNTNEGFYYMAFSLAGILFWSRCSTVVTGRRWALLGGVATGWAVCSKYTAVAPVAGIVAWHLAKMAGGNRVNELKKLAFFLGGAAAASFPYLANGWIFTGNPFYPLIFGGLHWVEANRQIMLAFGCPGTDFNPGNIGSIAGVLVRFFTVEQPVALLALPLIFLVRFPGMPAFLAAWLGAVVVWSLFIPCLRFMMPVYAALALMSGAGIGSWMKANPGRRWLAIWVVCISAGLGALHAVAAADSGKRSFNAAVGLEQPGMYLRRILSSYYRAVVEVNRLVPPGERILAVSERKGYLFNALVFNREIEDTPAMLEKVRESDSPQRLMIRLKQKGFGYILHNYVTSLYRSYWHSGHFIWRNDEVARYWRARDFLEPVWIDSAPDGANGGYVLYRILDKRESGRQHVYFLPGSESAGAEYWGEKPESYLGRMEKLNAIAPGVVFFEACLAHAYMGAGKNREAIEVLGHGLGIGSKYPEKDVLRYVKGVALGRLGRKREAIEELRKAEHESEVPENRDVFREEVEKLEEMR